MTKSEQCTIDLFIYNEYSCMLRKITKEGTRMYCLKNSSKWNPDLSNITYLGIYSFYQVISPEKAKELFPFAPI